MTDIFDPLTRPNLGAAPARRCPHPRPQRMPLDGGGWRCLRCKHEADPVVVRRNRANNGRGLAIQRKVLAAMDLEHIPGNKENHDGRSRGENGLHVAEVKSGLRFSAADWQNVVALPAKAGQARWLVKVETPGKGRKARVTVTTTLEDWQALFTGRPDGVEDDE
jgi:hypothetical protein